MDNYTINFKGQSISLHSVDFKLMHSVKILSPDFLTAVAENDYPFIRSLAAENVCTHPNVLEELLLDNSPTVYYAALDNPTTPILPALKRWYELMPYSKLSCSSPVINNKENFIKLLEDYNLTFKEADTLPNSWLVALLLSDNLNSV